MIFPLLAGRKRYVVYIDSDDQAILEDVIKKLRKSLRWSKITAVPKGVVEIYRI